MAKTRFLWSRKVDLSYFRQLWPCAIVFPVGLLLATMRLVSFHSLVPSSHLPGPLTIATLESVTHSRPISSIEIDANVSTLIDGSVEVQTGRRRVTLSLPDSFELIDDLERPTERHLRVALVKGAFSGELNGQRISDGPSTRFGTWNKFAQYSILYLSELPPYCGQSQQPKTEAIAGGPVTTIQVSGPCGSMSAIYEPDGHQVVRLVLPIRVSKAPRNVSAEAAAEIQDHPGYDVQGRLWVSEYRQVGGLNVPYRTEWSIDVRREVMTVTSIRVNKAL